MPVAEAIEKPGVAEDFYQSEGVRFIKFAVEDGSLVGVIEDGRIVEVDQILRLGSGETLITYYEEGEARIAKRKSGRAPAKTRIF